MRSAISLIGRAARIAVSFLAVAFVVGLAWIVTGVWQGLVWTTRSTVVVLGRRVTQTLRVVGGTVGRYAKGLARGTAHAVMRVLSVVGAGTVGIARAVTRWVRLLWRRLRSLVGATAQLAMRLARRTAQRAGRAARAVAAGVATAARAMACVVAGITTIVGNLLRAAALSTIALVRRLGRGARVSAMFLVLSGVRVARGVARAVGAAAARVAGVSRAAGARVARVSRAVLRRAPLHGRRLWLAVGIPVAGLAGLSTVAAISFFPPSMHPRSIAYAIASSELAVQTPLSSGNTPDLSNLYPLPEWSAVLAEEMTSPKLKALIAHDAGIPVGQLAIDGPIALDLQRTQQEPTEQKRSYQLLSEGDLYRVTLDTDINIAAVTITAQAPSQSAARELVLAVDRAGAAYLKGVEESAGTPPGDRVQVAQLQPVVITGGSGGHTVGALIFLIVYILWAGLVFLGDKLIRDVRGLGRLGPLLPSQVPASALRSSIKSKYGYGPISGRRGH